MDKQLMHERFAALREGMMQGWKETPWQFFAPLIELGRWMSRVTDAGAAPPLSHFTLSREAAISLKQAADKHGMSCQTALELAINKFQHQRDDPDD